MAAAVDITPKQDGGVLKIIKREGKGTSRPSVGTTVRVHYVGTLEENGSQFDSSRDRNQEFEFLLGREQVIKGWDIGVATMRQGELFLLLGVIIYIGSYIGKERRGGVAKAGFAIEG